MMSRRILVTAMLLTALAARARAADVAIEWDRDLAFEWDRANYEKTLADIVRSSHDEVAAWLGWTLERKVQDRGPAAVVGRRGHRGAPRLTVR